MDVSGKLFKKLENHTGENTVLKGKSAFKH